MEKKTKNASITIKVNEETKKIWEDRAKEEERTLSSLILKTMNDYIKEIEKAKKMLNQ